jgi:hypothetical protein
VVTWHSLSQLAQVLQVAGERGATVDRRTAAVFACRPVHPVTHTSEPVA